MGGDRSGSCFNIWAVIMRLKISWCFLLWCITSGVTLHHIQRVAKICGQPKTSLWLQVNINLLMISFHYSKFYIIDYDFKWTGPGFKIQEIKSQMNNKTLFNSIIHWIKTKKNPEAVCGNLSTPLLLPQELSISQVLLIK